MKNKPDTLQTVMLGYLTSIMAAFYNPTGEELVCKEKDQERKSELLRCRTVPGDSISTATGRSREEVRLLLFCSCTCRLSCGHCEESSVSTQVQQQH